MRYGSVAAVGFAVVLTSAGFAVARNRQSLYSTQSSQVKGGGGIFVEPNPVAYRIRRGEQLKHEIVLGNSHRSSINIARFSTTCTCLSLAVPQNGLLLEAGQHARVGLRIDMSTDPKYEGTFAPEIILYDHHNVEACKFSVTIEVTR